MLLKSQKQYKREIVDTIYLFAIQGVNYVFPLLVFSYLMITLGAEKFGYIGFSFSVIQYLMLIVDFGFNLSATKRIALHVHDSDEISRIASSTLLAKIGLLMVSVVILLIVAFAIPKFSIYRETLFIMFTMVIANVFSFIWLFQGLGNIRTASFINIISKALILPLTFVFVKSPDDYLIAASIQSGVYVLGAMITVVVIAKKQYIKRWYRSTMEEIKSELSASYPIFLSTAAVSIYWASYAIILAYFSDSVEVGKYSAVEKIMRGFASLILVPVTQSFYPKISALSVNNAPAATKLVRKISIFVLALSVIVFVLMFFFSGYLVRFLGDEYNGTLILFKIMSVTPIFIVLGGVYGQFGILAMGTDSDKKYFQRTYFIAGFIALVSIFLLSPFFQSVGAAISLVITEFSVFVGMFYYGRKYIFQKLNSN